MEASGCLLAPVACSGVFDFDKRVHKQSIYCIMDIGTRGVKIQ